MLYIDFLKDNPVVAFMVLLVLLITVVPAGAALYRRRHPKAPTDGDNPAGGKLQETKPVRFLGTQMDIAILLFGALMLLAIVARFFR